MKKWSILYGTLFFAACLVPSLGMVSGGGERSSENRELAKLPEFIGEDGLNPEFLKEAGEYFQDHFAYRNQLVTANALVMGKGFGVSAADGVIQGTDGWLYYMSIFQGHLNHPQHCFVVGTVIGLHPLVLPVHCQGVLGQVVGSNTEKIHLLGEFPADHHRRRCLNHNALLWNSKRNPLLQKSLCGFLHCFLNLFHFFFCGNHGIQHCQISKHRRTQKCPQLGLKNLRFS